MFLDHDAALAACAVMHEGSCMAADGTEQQGDGSAIPAASRHLELATWHAMLLQMMRKRLLLAGLQAAEVTQGDGSTKGSEGALTSLNQLPSADL